MLRAKYFLWLPVAGLLVFVSIMLNDAGVFREVKSQFLGACQIIRGVVGPEDMELDISSGLVFVSSDYRPKEEEPTPNGALYILHPDTKALKRITPDFEFDFHPHGISVVNLTSLVRIFVVNHRRSEGSIEVFDWSLDSQTLTHHKTIRDPNLLNNHNDVAAVDGIRFYVSLEQGSESRFWRKLEAYTRWGLGKVLFYDGSSFTPAATGLSYANGLALSLDRKHIYVAEMLAMRISKFEVGSPLRLVSRLPVEMGPDNIAVAPNGELWVAGHPKMFAIQRHQHDHQAPSPSRVIVMKADEKSGIYSEVYTDDGNFHPATSIALPLSEQRFLLGTIYAEQILDCTR